MSEGVTFWDGNKRRNWHVVEAVSRKALAHPEMLGAARKWLECNWRDDPSKARAYRIWRELLDQPAESFAKAVLAGSETAQEARESLPPFFVLNGREMAEAIRAARSAVGR